MYSADIVNLVIRKFIDGINITDISNDLHLSRQCIYNWIKKYKSNIDSVTTINSVTTKPYKKKRYRYVENIKTFVKNNEGCSLNAIKDNCCKDLSKSTIIRILKDSNITHKRITNKTVYKTEEAINIDRQNFVKSINYNINDVIFIDEVSFCVNDNEHYGYSESGKKIVKYYKHSRTKERLTSIAAISNSGMVCYKIIEGSVDKNVYKGFLEENVKLFENKILIQDNARCHHSKIVKDFAKDNKVCLKYNPAYSPDFNPIEFSFNKIKALYRQYDHRDIRKDIINAFSSVTSDNCQAFYNKSNEVINKYK